MTYSYAGKDDFIVIMAHISQVDTHAWDRKE